MKYKSSVLSAVLIFVIVGISVPARAQLNQKEPSPDENGVYEAVLGLMDHMPIEDPHITIFGMTLNSKFGEAAGPYIPLADGCTFLWMKPDTANSVKKLLHGEWKDFDSSTWSDFETKNAASVRLREPIATPWKHKLIFPGDEPAKDWDSPNLAIFLSSVGFNQKKTEAVVYVLVFSYMDRVETAGDYFLFRIGKSGHWEPNGLVTYFTKDKDQASK